jgi:membrane protein YdbS with pleckstrin-like domain
VERRLHPSNVLLNRLIGAIFTGVVAVAAFIAIVVLLLVPSVPGWVKLVVFLGGLLLTAALGTVLQVWPAVEHRYTSYRVGSLGIEIRRGVVWRRIIIVPRSRVQHTDVSQGPVQRRLGLGTLHMFTAGTEHSKVELAGLGHDIALRIRDHLMPGGEDDAV